ncbi:MAG: hypothetical protein AAF363_12280 [Bacteroidota bacterium]
MSKEKSHFYLMKEKLFILSCFLVFLTITSCDDDSEVNPSDPIIGEWFDSNPFEGEGLIQSLQYAFNTDGTFESRRVVLEDIDGEILGYLARAIGTFELEGDQLVLSSAQIFIHDDPNNAFSNLDRLTLTDATSEGLITISFNGDQTQLTFTFLPCGPNENCLADLVFERKVSSIK